MKITTIKLKNDKDISEACSLFNSLDNDIDAVCGRYVIDAKSLIGLMFFLNQNIDIYMRNCYSLYEKDLLKDELEKWEV